MRGPVAHAVDGQAFSLRHQCMLGACSRGTPEELFSGETGYPTGESDRTVSRASVDAAARAPLRARLAFLGRSQLSRRASYIPGECERTPRERAAIGMVHALRSEGTRTEGPCCLPDYPSCHAPPSPHPWGVAVAVAVPPVRCLPPDPLSPSLCACVRACGWGGERMEAHGR